MGKQALEGSRLNAFGMDPDDIVIIGLDTDDGEEHPLYDDRIHLKLDERLVRNIMVNGVLQPITVRKDANNRPCVVIGRQRVRAAREANKRLEAEGKETIMIPVHVRRGEESSMFGVMVSENECRRQDEILTKARKAVRMINMGKSESEVAVMFGVTPHTIGSWIKLTELDATLLKAVERGEISASQALEKSGATAAEQKALAAEVRGKKANGKGRPKGAKATRPGKVQITKTFEKLTKLKRYESHVPTQIVQRLCSYILGQISEDDVFA